jgi:hypothetical protein
MKYFTNLVIVLCLFVIVTGVTAQSAITSNGGNATGAGGSAAYTVGQLSFSVVTGTNGFIIQGVQQPYEISTVTAIESTDDISLEYIIFPNPTCGIVRLGINPFREGRYSFRLYDLGGKIIREDKITDKDTEISFESLPPAVYLLRILVNYHEVKVFKVVKNK